MWQAQLQVAQATLAHQVQSSHLSPRRVLFRKKRSEEKFIFLPPFPWAWPTKTQPQESAQCAAGISNRLLSSVNYRCSVNSKENLRGRRSCLPRGQRVTDSHEAQLRLGAPERATPRVKGLRFQGSKGAVGGGRQRDRPRKIPVGKFHPATSLGFNSSGSTFSGLSLR